MSFNSSFWAKTRRVREAAKPNKELRDDGKLGEEPRGAAAEAGAVGGNVARDVFPKSKKRKQE